jgi:hypothetical protein
MRRYPLLMNHRSPPDPSQVMTLNRSNRRNPSNQVKPTYSANLQPASTPIPKSNTIYSSNRSQLGASFVYCNAFASVFLTCPTCPLNSEHSVAAATSSLLQVVYGKWTMRYVQHGTVRGFLAIPQLTQMSSLSDDLASTEDSSQVEVLLQECVADICRSTLIHALNPSERAM